MLGLNITTLRIPLANLIDLIGGKRFLFLITVIRTMVTLVMS